jgi:hypothetical protein
MLFWGLLYVLGKHWVSLRDLTRPVQLVSNTGIPIGISRGKGQLPHCATCCCKAAVNPKAHSQPSFTSLS